MATVRRRALILVALTIVGVAQSGLPAAAHGGGALDRPRCVPGSVVPMRSPRLAYAARLVRTVDVRPIASARARARFERLNANGVPTVFGVLVARVDRSCSPTDYKVQLPMRPNGSTGWVRAAAVRLSEVRTRITVDLSQRRITLFRGGRVMLVTTAVVGSPATPTPIGHFYVNQRLLAANPLGDYGPGAVGISAFSPVLLHWPQGGPIAIHGTDAPGLIGFAVSHGCLRVRNDDARRLLRLVAEGTPVDIRR